VESIDLTTGLPTARFKLPAGRLPIPDAVFSPGGTKAALQVTRASQDPRFRTGSPYPPADVVILHLQTGRLDIVPGLELPPLTRAGRRSTPPEGGCSRRSAKVDAASC